MFFYSETPAPGPKPEINVWRMNGTKAYLKHYDQYLFLHFVTENPRATQTEKRQAHRELSICEKKLAFWERHPNFVKDEALAGVIELKKKWAA